MKPKTHVRSAKIKTTKGKSFLRSSKNLKKSKKDIDRDYIQRQKEEDPEGYRKRRQDTNRRYYYNKKARLSRKTDLQEKKSIQEAKKRTCKNLKGNDIKDLNEKVRLMFQIAKQKIILSFFDTDISLHEKFEGKRTLYFCQRRYSGRTRNLRLRWTKIY